MIKWSNVEYKCTAKNVMTEIMLRAYFSTFCLSGSHLVQFDIHSNVKGLIYAAERMSKGLKATTTIFLSAKYHSHRKKMLLYEAVEILSCQTHISFGKVAVNKVKPMLCLHKM